MSFIYSLTDTWNAIGTTFNAIYMNISNGAGGAPVGAAASRAFRLDSNSVKIFDVDISGNTAIGLGSVSTVGRLHVRTGADQNFQFRSFVFGTAGVLLSAANDANNSSVPLEISTSQLLITGGNVAIGVLSAGFPSAAALLDLGEGVAAQKLLMFHTGNARYGYGIASFEHRIFCPSDAHISLGTISTADGSTWSEKMRVVNTGNILINTAAIATNATDGFLHIPTCAGTPTGVPSLTTGLVPMIFDTANSQFWFYTGGAWKQPKTPAGAAIVTWQ